MRFDTTLSQFGRNTGIEVPDDIIERLDAGRRPAVVVRVNGYEYLSTVGVMGGKSLIPFSADKRAETGIAGGDEIAVEIELDTAPREVEVPAELASALDAAGIRAAFDALSPSARKAHVASVGGAKGAQTRARRVEKIVASLADPGR